MADLTDDQKREIVEALACYTKPAEIIAHFQIEHGLELEHVQVGRYDPTRPYYAAGDQWREIFEAARKNYLESVADVPIANQGYRLKVLQRGIEAAEKAKNWPLVAQLAEQAAKEVGGVLTNQRNLKVEDSRRQRVSDMSEDEKRMAFAELIRTALEAAPARLATIEGTARETVQ